MSDSQRQADRFHLFISFASRDRVLIGRRRRAVVLELKRLLEAHVCPPIVGGERPRRFRVCTDQDDFAIGQPLSAAIRERIAESSALLVICSQAAVESPYVRQEIELFVRLNPGKLPLAARLDLLPDQAFPTAFAPGELGADLAPAPGSTLRQWRAKLRAESHKIVARVLGLPLAMVHDRFEHERKVRWRWIVGSSVAAVTLLAVALTWGIWAWSNWRIEEEHRAEVAYATTMKSIQQSWDRLDVEQVKKLLDGLRPVRGERDLRGFEWYYYWLLSHQGPALMHGHQGAVHCLAISPDGSLVASGGLDKTVRLWDLPTATSRATLGTQSDDVRAVAFSHDGRTLASAGADGVIHLWDVTRMSPSRVLKGHATWINSLCFSPDRQTLASGGDDGAIHLWDVAAGTGQVLGEKSDDGVLCVAFSSDGETLASGGRDGFVRLWDVDTRTTRRVFTDHDDRVTALTFSPDGYILASASFDSTIRFWNPNSGEASGEVIQGNGEGGLSFTPDGLTLAGAGSDGAVHLWHVNSRQEQVNLQAQRGWLNGVACTPDGSQIVSASQDGTLAIWDVAKANRQAIHQLHDEPVTALASAPAGGTVAVGFEDGAVTLWDATSASVRRPLDGHAGRVNGLAFSCDGRLVASAGDDQFVRLWDVALGKLQAELRHPDSVTAVAFALQQPLVVSAGRDGEIRMWDTSAGNPVARRLGKPGRVKSLAVSRDGKCLASAGEDGATRLWDLESGAEFAALTGAGWPDEYEAIYSVAISPDRVTLAAGGSSSTLALWGLTSRQERFQLKEHQGLIASLAFTPGDGRTLATGSRDRTIKLWRPSVGVELAALGGYKGKAAGPVHVTFLSNGRSLVTGNPDGTVKIWSAARDSEVAGGRKSLR